jgi:hypothetical protein
MRSTVWISHDPEAGKPIAAKSISGVTQVEGSGTRQQKAAGIFALRLAGFENLWL